MVDPRIIDYIKSQLSRRVSVNQIKQSLLSQGWSNYDIDQAINLALQNNSGVKNMSVLALLLVLLYSYYQAVQ